MNQAQDLEARLEELGARLRRRPTLADGLMRHVREEPAAPEVARVEFRGPRRFWRRYRSLALVLATIAVVLPLALLILPVTPQVGLAQVTEKLRAQKWIHAVEKGDRPGLMEMWLSPEHQISAMDLGDVVRFANGKERAKYEYTPGRRKEIWKFPLGDNLDREIVPWNAVDKGQEGVGPWLFGNEAILSQERKEVVEKGKRLIEDELMRHREQ